jgi:hypothetical protein
MERDGDDEQQQQSHRQQEEGILRACAEGETTGDQVSPGREHGDELATRRRSAKAMTKLSR